MHRMQAFYWKEILHKKPTAKRQRGIAIFAIARFEWERVQAKCIELECVRFSHTFSSVYDDHILYMQHFYFLPSLHAIINNPFNSFSMHNCERCMTMTISFFFFWLWLTSNRKKMSRRLCSLMKNCFQQWMDESQFSLKSILSKSFLHISDYARKAKWQLRRNILACMSNVP